MGLYRILIWPDTGYPTKNKCYVIFLKLNVFFFNLSSFVYSNSSFIAFNFLNFLDINNLIAIAHNINNFVYTATGYPVSGQPDIRQTKPDIRLVTGY